MKLEQACELGLINSPQYQDQRGVVPRQPPVSLQRFAFAWLFTSSGDVFRESTGAETVQPP